MFSKEEEMNAEENEDDDENLKNFKTHDVKRFVCPYAGRFAIRTDSRTVAKVPDERIDFVNRFFSDIANYEPTAKKNITVLIALISCYVIINIFHIVNIFALGNAPLTYVKICWFQHTFLAAFWVGVVLTFKKLPLYSQKVLDVVNMFEQQEKCKITLHNNLNIIEFKFESD